MIIKLDDRWQLRRLDGLNFVIEYFAEGGISPKTKEKAPDRWQIKGYYGDLAHAIASIPRHVPFDPTIGDLATLELRIRRIAENLEQAAEPIVSELERASRSLAEKLASRIGV